MWGVAFAVSERDLLRLDRYEGTGIKAYERREIGLHDREGRAISAWTYFALPNGDEEFTPHRDYIDLYVKGATYFELPPEYLKSLKQIRNSAKQN